MRENRHPACARYLFFTPYSLWWLTSYPELAAHLEANARRLDVSEDFRIYDLAQRDAVAG